MQASEYQRLAMRTKADHPWQANLLNAALGLTGEAGEVAEHVKKWQFHAHPLEIGKIEKELSDVMWYVALACDALGLDMDGVMQANIDKLAARYPDGFSSERSINRSE